MPQLLIDISTGLMLVSKEMSEILFKVRKEVDLEGNKKKINSLLMNLLDTLFLYET
jgi:hypothetical protein